MDTQFDIVIVGAGAAGLAAAVRLASEPVSVIVLEARDRIGGRAHTEVVQGYALDLGCGWLHSADINPFSGVAQRLGFEIDKSPPHWTRQAWNLNFTAEDQTAFGQSLGALEDRIASAAARGEDRPVAELMDPASPWNPLLDTFSGAYNGAEFDQISTLDYDAYQDTEVNWRLPAGYGALIAAFGANTPVKLATPVTAIDHSGARVRVETDGGVLSAGAVIVTLPTDILASDAIRFTPELPKVRQAASALPLGLANKVVLSIDEPDAFPIERHLFGDPRRTDTGGYHLRPFGRPLIEAFLGGRNARALDAEGPGAATDFAVQELVALLGSDLRKRLHPLSETRWAADMWSRGAYSHAAPGGAWARAALATLIDNRLFFAGEASSPHAFSTAHGAAQSGVTAAEAALASMPSVKTGA